MDKIKNILAEQLDADAEEMTMETNIAKDLGADSLDVVELLMTIEDEFNIWKMLTPEDVDQIYDSYPNSGGDLIQAVYEDVKKKRKRVGNAVPYILGYADKVLWDDNAEHGGEP